jgi:uncharacterized protein YdaU (DUF1376 family)
MPLYVADYLVDTLDLRAEESGVYLLLLMIAWRRPDGALPNDMKWLQRSLASCVNDMHGNRFNRLVPPILERFFVLGEDNKFRNKRLTKEREKSEKFSEKQKENAEKRWGAVKENNSLVDAKPMPAHALQLQSQSQRKEDPAPAGSSKVYAFEAGVIKLNQRDFDRWKAAFSFLDLAAELVAMAPWAEQQASWFHAVPNALRNRNRDAKAAKEKQQQNPFKWNGIEGVI